MRPLSTDDEHSDKDAPIVKKDVKKQRTRTTRRQPSKSDSELDPAEMERLQLEQLLQHKDRLASIPVERRRSHQPSDSTDQDIPSTIDRGSTPG